jgi:hypothetical protein
MKSPPSNNPIVKEASVDGQNAAHVSYFGRLGPGQNLGFVRRERPKPTEWDQLLAKLALNDSQALDAAKSDGEEGELLRKFLLRFFRHYFVPEAKPRVVAETRSTVPFR